MTLGFAGSPLDRAEPLRRDPAALAALRADPAARVLLMDGLKPVMRPGPPPAIAWAKPAAAGDPSAWVLLGLEAGTPRFAAAGVAGAGSEAIDARAAAMACVGTEAAIIGHARSLLDFHARFRFCPACGGATASDRGGQIRRCAGCGVEQYPRVDPVAIMLVIDRAADAALLGRGARMPAGFLSALAGFVEPGESLEEAVAREVREEAGVRVGSVAYVASQPWPFASQLMLGCIAEAASTQITIDPAEIEEARWVGRAEMVEAMAGRGALRVPPPLAIARTLIAAWLSGR